MKKPVAQGDIEALKKLGIEVYDSYIMPGERRISVKVELEVPLEFKVEEQFAFLIKNKRGFGLLVSGWATEVRGEHNVLSFDVEAGTDANLPAYSAFRKEFTSFVDLCWFIGNEKITDQKIAEIDFPVAEGYQPGDLAWQLPSRFIDPFIQTMGVLNDVVFGGALKDSVVYGVKVV